MNQQIQGYDATKAINYHYGKFPPQHLDYKVLTPFVSRVAASLARYDALLRGLPNKDLLLAPLRRQEAVISSRIEGTVATLDEVLKFEAEENDEDGKKKFREEVIEVYSYSRALNHAQQLINEGLPLCGRLIKEAHKKLLFLGRGADKQPGEFKKEQNYVVDRAQKRVLFIPISPLKLEDGMRVFEDFLNDLVVEPLLQTALAHAEFESLHPFKDGNGRVGRMLITLCLWTKGLINAPHFYISGKIESRRDEYIERLRLVSAEGQWTEWCQFFLEIVEEQAKQNLEVAEKIGNLYNDMKVTFRKALASKWMISAQDYIFENPIFRNNVFTSRAGIPKQTAARFTKTLVEKKLLTILEPASGRRSGLYAFEPLLNIVRS